MARTFTGRRLLAHRGFGLRAELQNQCHDQDGYRSRLVQVDHWAEPCRSAEAHLRVEPPAGDRAVCHCRHHQPRFVRGCSAERALPEFARELVRTSADTDSARDEACQQGERRGMHETLPRGSELNPRAVSRTHPSTNSRKKPHDYSSLVRCLRFVQCTPV